MVARYAVILFAICSVWPAHADEPPPGPSIMIIMTEEEQAKLVQFMGTMQLRIETLENALRLAKIKSGCV